MQNQKAQAAHNNNHHHKAFIKLKLTVSVMPSPSFLQFRLQCELICRRLEWMMQLHCMVRIQPAEFSNNFKH
uniref:Uncharacterized protein n=1 Tax=Anguilla anguilla TaxID=7936 RepID=A0A0E9PDK8_ANGAN